MSPDWGRELSGWWHTPVRARMFSLTVTLVALAGTCWGLAADGGWSELKLLAAVAVAGVVVAELGNLARIAGGVVTGRVQWGLSAWPLAAALLVSPLLVGVVTAATHLSMRHLGDREPVWKWVTFGSIVTISAWAAGGLFTGVSGSALQDRGTAAQLGALAAAIPAYLAVEVVLLSAFARSAAQDEFTVLLRSRLRNGDFYLSELTVLAAGVSVAVICRYGSGFLLLAAPMLVMLQRAWLYLPYKRKALEDPRTGLLNYPAWRQAASVAVRRELADGGSCSVLFLDLDHFKAVNDRYGHAAGDEVLVAVAEVLRQQTRPRDLVGRYGGEEFCALLPGADAGQGAEAAERLRAVVAALRFSRRTLRVTASFGVAARDSGLGLGSDPNEIDSLVQCADKALYAAKQGGRDQVCVRTPGQE